MESEFSGFQKKRIRISKVIGSVILALVLVWFFTHPDLYHNVIIKADGSQRVSLARFKILMMIVMAAAGMIVLWTPCFLPQKLRRVYAIVTFLMTSVIMIFALEYASIRRHRTPLQVWHDIGYRKLFLTWIAVILIASWFALLVNRWQIASMMTAIFICIFGVVCYLVYTMRGTPFTASDLTVLQTAANVAGDYDYNIDFYTLFLVTFTIVWCDIVLWAGSVKVFSGWKLRVAALAVMIACTVLFDRVYFHSDMLSRNSITMNTFKPEKSYGKHGTILAFLRSVQLMFVEKPEGYNIVRVEAIEAEYMAESGSQNETEPAVSAIASTEAAAAQAAKASGKSFTPNIIIVMDEAFTDMQSWMNFETDEEVCPFFNSLKEDTIRGKFYVSSYGGRTANTEYEVLTEDSVGFLPLTSSPYQLYIKDPMPNLNSDLKHQGYRHTVGMHPFEASGYKRSYVYELFGFDKRVFLDDFKDPELIRRRVSDMEDVNRIIAEYEEARSESDAPFFIHNVTMQNHSPYNADADNLGDTVHVVSGTGDYSDADTYLTLVRKTDKALEKLVNYFKEVDEPTVILFFGDHQPNLKNEFYQMAYGKSMGQMKGEELMQFFHSNYIIWANFDIEEQEMDLSSNYLIPVMKQAVGMDLTGYERFLLDLHEDLPIVSLNGYWDKDGIFYEKLNDKNSVWYERLQDYNMLIYNHLFDKEHRADEFFGGSVEPVAD